MKLRNWLLIFGGIIILILGLLLTLVLTLDISWWWFLGFLFAFIAIGIIVAIILVFRNSKPKEPQKIKATAENAENAVKMRLKLDEDEPDELIIEESKTITEGQSGTEKTHIHYIKGTLYHSGDELHAFVDLDDIERITIMKNPSLEELKQYRAKFALNPIIEETEEEIIVSSETGKPVRKTIKTKQTPQQKRKAEEAKEIEETESL